MVREKLVLSDKGKKLLLHSCCAPCSGEVMEAIMAFGIEFSMFFYNPNIHPKKEYELPEEENIRFAEKYGILFINADYDVDDWFDHAKGMELEPERGIGRTMCFDMRVERTALYAHGKGFDTFLSALGISRWKNMEEINGTGLRAANHHEGLTYWTYNRRKKGGSLRMLKIRKDENFYMQEYCGRAYSLRDTNKWRMENGRGKIKLGENYYGS